MFVFLDDVDDDADDADDDDDEANGDKRYL